MSGVDAAEALARAAGLGPYFGWEPAGDLSGWRPWPELADGTVLAERVAAARTALATMGGLPEDAIPGRVVASVAFLGYAARVLSPLLGAAALTGTVPAATKTTLWWRPVPAGPLPIAYASISGTRPASPEALREVAVEAILEPVLLACRARFRLSPQVLWGNVTSALAGAATMITTADPVAGERAGALVEGLLALPPLAGTGTLRRPSPTGPRRVLTRNNCCLYYRIPGGGTCGDCVLRRNR
ncbi:(2Fe-2S)-binding protein [Paractinoplanes durhamensis]|uniref:(2Fe-2S)-binding protein n=1 Tax=Paractinoplanes durhamensis TaxID=113563 RepID=UPI001EF3D53B|nr:(2Fe-2S)-binding protein [Actinoplanes durhamensis]